MLVIGDKLAVACQRRLYNIMSQALVDYSYTFCHSGDDLFNIAATRITMHGDILNDSPKAKTIARKRC